MSIDSKSYCPAAFREMMLIPGDVMLLCCQHDTDIPIVNSLKETYEHTAIQQIRQEMLAGNPIPGCEQCYYAETIGTKSKRMELIERYGYPTNIEIHHVTVSFENVCNLKCRFCFSTNSHLLYADELELYGTTFANKKYNITTTYDDIDLSTLVELTLHGGEPFLSMRADKFFKNLIDADKLKDITVSIPTNGTVLPPANTMHGLLNCKKLNLRISIDGVGRLNNYFRSGSEWETIVENLKVFDSFIDQRPPGSTSIEINTAVNVYNVNVLADIDNFFTENFPRIRPLKSVVNSPAFMDIANLPEEYKAQVRPTLENNPIYADILKKLNYPGIDLFPELVYFHNKLDQIRQEELGESNAMLDNFFKSYVPTKKITQRDMIKIVNLRSPNV
jgi:sulfatase maturation enzyme AslB (radical SAM superfamily)